MNQFVLTDRLIPIVVQSYAKNLKAVYVIKNETEVAILQGYKSLESQKYN